MNTEVVSPARAPDRDRLFVENDDENISDRFGQNAAAEWQLGR